MMIYCNVNNEWICILIDKIGSCCVMVIVVEIFVVVIMVVFVVVDINFDCIRVNIFLFCFGF